MPRVQLQRFEDLSSPKAPGNDGGHAVDRRAFLGLATTLAATSAMAPEAFARNFGPDAEP